MNSIYLYITLTNLDALLHNFKPNGCHGSPFKIKPWLNFAGNVVVLTCSPETIIFSAEALLQRGYFSGMISQPIVLRSGTIDKLMYQFGRFASH